MLGNNKGRKAGRQINRRGNAVRLRSQPLLFSKERFTGGPEKRRALTDFRYKNQVVASAEGEASRFLAIYDEYKNAKAVTQERMYLETMEKVLAGIDKIIIDKNSSGGVVPYLPLPELGKNKGNVKK